jgi:hypothetical protein
VPLPYIDGIENDSLPFSKRPSEIEFSLPRFSTTVPVTSVS